MSTCPHFSSAHPLDVTEPVSENSSQCERPPQTTKDSNPSAKKKPTFSTKPSSSSVQQADNNFLDAHAVQVNCGAAVQEPKERHTKDEDTVGRWLSFIKDLLSALAWPIVAIIATWRLGPELKKKIPALKSFEAGPLKAEFSEEVEAVRREAEEQFPQQQEGRKLSPEESRLIEVAKVSPRASIIEAWRAVETTAARAIERRSEPAITSAPISYSIRNGQSRPKSLITLSKELSALGILNTQQVLVFNELRNLRNQAAHAEQFDMDFESANNYIQSALTLRAAIESA